MRYLQEAFEYHARTRFAERFRMQLTDGDLRRIGKYIRDGGGIVLNQQPYRRVMVAVPAGPEGKLVPVIYSNKHKSIITVLPGCRLKQHQQKLEAEKQKLQTLGQWPLRLPEQEPPTVKLVPDGHPGKVVVWCDPLTCPFRVAIDLREQNGQRVVERVYYPNGCTGNMDKFRQKMRERFKNPMYTRERWKEGTSAAKRFIKALLNALDRENIRWETPAPALAA